jgi:hypothetical protein
MKGFPEAVFKPNPRGLSNQTEYSLMDFWAVSKAYLARGWLCIAFRYSIVNVLCS